MNIRIVLSLLKLNDLLSFLLQPQALLGQPITFSVFVHMYKGDVRKKM